MNILGVYNPSTSFGKKLKQGGACVISDNKIIVSISEERITRKKCDFGYDNAINYCLEFSRLSNNEIDLVVTSSCCENKAEVRDDLISRFKRVETCNHHLSHAYSAYFCSHFDAAIVIVIDGGGNTLEESKTKEWWKLGREQVSIYSAISGKIKLIERIYSNPYDTGFGETFRYFTKYLGFGSSYNAGKVMALSSYGSSSDFQFSNIFYKEEIVSPFRNDPFDPINTLQSYLNKLEFNSSPRSDTCNIQDHHKNLAFLVQCSYQLSLKHLIDKYINKTGIKNVCIAGGVALNCIANSYILRECKLQNLFVQPASSDTGQCLGNAIYGQSLLENGLSRIIFNNVYLGKSYHPSKSDLQKLIQGTDKYGITELSDYKQIAAFISEGKIIGWFQGRSEFGPRSLGNRSILADPRKIEVSKKINESIKKREDFMPFAASILSDYCEEYFLDNVCEYMTLAPRVRKNKIKLIPAVVHVDSSCRAQKVNKTYNIKFYNLINEFYNITNIPMVLNTSLNGPGEPICETPNDAFELFKNYPLDYLVIENYLLYKT